jgi:hypothetical protein
MKNGVFQGNKFVNIFIALVLKKAAERKQKNQENLTKKDHKLVIKRLGMRKLVNIKFFNFYNYKLQGLQKAYLITKNFNFL